MQKTGSYLIPSRKSHLHDLGKSRAIGGIVLMINSSTPTRRRSKEFTDPLLRPSFRLSRSLITSITSPISPPLTNAKHHPSTIFISDMVLISTR
jgi:hypothetical protein